MTTVVVYTLLLITCYLLLSETHIVDIMTILTWYLYVQVSVVSGLWLFLLLTNISLADLFSGLKTWPPLILQEVGNQDVTVKKLVESLSQLKVFLVYFTLMVLHTNVQFVFFYRFLVYRLYKFQGLWDYQLCCHVMWFHWFWPRLGGYWEMLTSDIS